VSLTNVLALVGVVFAVNLMPAFGPPTWAVLVFFRLQSHVPAVPLVLFGAVAAACGRYLLARGSRHFRGRLSPKRVESLNAVQGVVAGSRGRALAGLGLFALSPLPSAQLFVGAGLLGVSLLPLTAAFFAGRLVSYSIYVGAASAAHHSLGSIFGKALLSPWGVALQVAMLVALVVLLRVDWAKLIARRAGTKGEPASSHSRGD
jgi:membrane protein YqaA with SNARE-associated domain